MVTARAAWFTGTVRSAYKVELPFDVARSMRVGERVMLVSANGDHITGELVHDGLGHLLVRAEHPIFVETVRVRRRQTTRLFRGR